MSFSPAAAGLPPGETGTARGHRFRETAVLDVTGEDRVGFLQGQLTQDVITLLEGETRPAAGLSPKGKLLFTARLIRLPDRLRLLVPASRRDAVARHLTRFAVFQKVAVEDRSEEFLRIGLYGPTPPETSSLPGAFLLPGEGELSGELLVPRSLQEEAERLLADFGSEALSDEAAEIRRVEAGRPRFGQDMDESHLPDEIGMEPAISTTKGCYVGQEIVARLRTYGRVNRRLVGYRFPDGLLRAGTLLRNPEEPEPGRIDWGRVTSAVDSPRFGPIGLGFAFREIPVGGRLVADGEPDRGAVVALLPFA